MSFCKKHLASEVNTSFKYLCHIHLLNNDICRVRISEVSNSINICWIFNNSNIEKKKYINFLKT